MGVALSWDALEDLEKVDFDKLGFASGTRESMLSQQQTLVASFYLDGLDFFGGVPLYTTTQSEVKGRSTALETFNFIDSLLNVATPNLPVKDKLGAMETGSIHRAVAAVLKARLYFNAETYIGKDMRLSHLHLSFRKRIWKHFQHFRQTEKGFIFVQRL